jgi:hypothetical protein
MSRLIALGTAFTNFLTVVARAAYHPRSPCPRVTTIQSELGRTDAFVTRATENTRCPGSVVLSLLHQLRRRGRAIHKSVRVHAHELAELQ